MCYSGFTGYRNGQIKSFPRKRKFIELYLYSMGVVFAKYKEALTQPLYLSQCSRNTTTDSPDYLTLKAKVLLLNELGVTQFLRDKYRGNLENDIEHKIAEVLRIIIGENADVTKNIIEYLD